jgi:DNA-directed RNA polymerase specialized sigma24 family protein
VIFKKVIDSIPTSEIKKMAEHYKECECYAECGFMLIESRAVLASLDRIVGHFISDASLREDFRQEAIVHLWRMEAQIPGQTISWYLQHCRYHLQHVLASGKSVDALKRSSGRLQDGDPGRSEQSLPEAAQQSGEDVFGEVSANELTALLMGQLGPRQQEVLKKLAEGFTINEISLQLGLTHQAISKHRQCIATTAEKLGLRPRSSCLPAAFATVASRSKQVRRCTRGTCQ